MNENEFGKKVAQRLNAGLARLDDTQLAKLHAAREMALRAYKPPVSVLGLATVSGHVLEIGYWVRKPLFWLPVLAVVAAISFYSFNNTVDARYDEFGELDAKLLAGELPIDAFLDKDFADWVKESGE
jgi:Protein of unknown function (DUF3619)